MQTWTIFRTLDGIRERIAGNLDSDQALEFLASLPDDQRGYLEAVAE